MEHAYSIRWLDLHFCTPAMALTIPTCLNSISFSDPRVCFQCSGRQRGRAVPRKASSLPAGCIVPVATMLAGWWADTAMRWADTGLGCVWRSGGLPSSPAPPPPHTHTAEGAGCMVGGCACMWNCKGGPCALPPWAVAVLGSVHRWFAFVVALGAAAAISLPGCLYQNMGTSHTTERHQRVVLQACVASGLGFLYSGMPCAATEMRSTAGGEGGGCQLQAVGLLRAGCSKQLQPHGSCPTGILCRCTTTAGAMALYSVFLQLAAVTWFATRFLCQQNGLVMSCGQLCV
jgi:hypothetical protein